jgi:hypothetical protein
MKHVFGSKLHVKGWIFQFEIVNIKNDENNDIIKL